MPGALEHWSNQIYMRRFMKLLRAKVEEKRRRFPGAIDDHDLHRMRSFAQFDQAYTAPMHGFRDAQDYWSRCSCKQFLDSIRIPTLLINAQDDPFLRTPSCFPYAQASRNRQVYLETPPRGGHVGFVQFNASGTRLLV